MYIEIPAPPSLEDFVECFWTRDITPSEATGRTHRVLPDGCVDFIVEIGSNPYLIAVGTMTRPLLLEGRAPHEFIGVRFKPGRAYTMLGIPAEELTDDRVPLSEIWKDVERLLNEVVGGATVNDRVAALARALEKRLVDAPGPAPEVDGAIRAIVESGGSIEIATLGPAIGVTRQHLARSFARWVGVPPKTFARVVRLQRLLEALRSARDPHWNALATWAGYYDQSHLVAEFKELTGVTPSAWTRPGRLGPRA
jgi:AraC-like DNA-binding protein